MCWKCVRWRTCAVRFNAPKLVHMIFTGAGSNDFGDRPWKYQNVEPNKKNMTMKQNKIITER